MAKDAAELLREALDLPAEARAAIAGSLLDSLEEVCDPDAEQRWKEEIIRRVGEVDSGAVPTISWVEARRRLWSQIEP